MAVAKAKEGVSKKVDMREVPGEEFRISRHPISFGPTLTKLLNSTVPPSKRNYAEQGSYLTWFEVMALRTAYKESPAETREQIKRELDVPSELELTLVPDSAQYQKAWINGSISIILFDPPNKWSYVAGHISHSVLFNMVELFGINPAKFIPEFILEHIPTLEEIFPYNEWVSDLLFYSIQGPDSKTAKHLLQSLRLKENDLPVLVRNPRVTVNPDFHYDYPPGNFHYNRKAFRGYELTEGDDTKIFYAPWPIGTRRVVCNREDLDSVTGFPLRGVRTVVLSEGSENGEGYLFRDERFDHSANTCVPVVGSRLDKFDDTQGWEEVVYDNLNALISHISAFGGLSAPYLANPGNFWGSAPWNHLGTVRVVVKPKG